MTLMITQEGTGRPPCPFPQRHRNRRFSTEIVEYESSYDNAVDQARGPHGIGKSFFQFSKGQSSSSNGKHDRSYGAYGSGLGSGKPSKDDPSENEKSEQDVSPSSPSMKQSSPGRASSQPEGPVWDSSGTVCRWLTGKRRLSVGRNDGSDKKSANGVLCKHAVHDKHSARREESAYRASGANRSRGKFQFVATVLHLRQGNDGHGCSRGKTRSGARSEA